jgi:cobaltochelatase CobS
MSTIQPGYVVLSSDENVTLVANEQGLGKIQVLLKNGVLYNYGGWYPESDRTKNRMSYNRQDEAKAIHAKAVEYQEKLRSEAGAPVPEPERSLAEMLQDSVIQALGAGVAEQIAPVVSAKVEAQIIKTFGFKPIVHEIKKGNEKVEIEGAVHGAFDDVLLLVDNKIPVMLTGAAGSGKNHLCKQIADALKLDFHFVNAVTNEYRLTGFIDANGHFHKTEFFKAFTEGGLFMLDEIDASNGYFDFPTGRAVAHEDFRAIAAANTFGTGADMQYTGRFQLDAASLDRFSLVHVDYDDSVELCIANGDTEIVQFVKDLRQAMRTAGIKFVISYRASGRLATMKDILSDERIMATCITKSLDHDDLTIINESMKHKGNRWAKAFSTVALGA